MLEGRLEEDNSTIEVSSSLVSSEWVVCSEEGDEGGQGGTSASMRLFASKGKVTSSPGDKDGLGSRLVALLFLEECFFFLCALDL